MIQTDNDGSLTKKLISLQECHVRTTLSSDIGSHVLLSNNLVTL